MPLQIPPAVRDQAKSFLDFLNEGVTPYHAVRACVRLLNRAGFVELRENENFQLQPGGKYYMLKNETAIFAFAAGGRYEPGNGFAIVAAHTDSPCLRLKPISKRTSDKFLQVGVSTYGGGLWRTWFDRDLSIAGQIIYRKQSAVDSTDHAIYHKLIRHDRPMLYIPSLAIHLDDDPANFKPNKETHLLPIMATKPSTRHSGRKPDNLSSNFSESIAPPEHNGTIIGDHASELLQTISAAAQCSPADILDVDLYLYDTQPAGFTGLYDEFISGARLDNLVGVYTAIIGLINSVQDESGDFAADTKIRLAACYDNEEVGSGSAQGAFSSITEWILRRLSADPSDPTAFERSIGDSLLISVDQAHAAHPNYMNKHEDKHRPGFHEGVVVKINVNQRYATTAFTHAVLKMIADRADVPLQKVVVRNDSHCGSTVGPILAQKLGMQSIDVGCAQLAMHSIRELCDITSISHAISLFSTFYSHLSTYLNVKRDALE